MESRECVYCINFKTITITDKNCAAHHQADCDKVRRKLSENGSVQIWYCKFGIMDKVYITKQIIDKIKRPNCMQYNNPHLK
jgi:hypothetical protein